jgi:hypothetical protein
MPSTQWTHQAATEVPARETTEISATQPPANMGPPYAGAVVVEMELHVAGNPLMQQVGQAWAHSAFAARCSTGRGTNLEAGVMIVCVRCVLQLHPIVWHAPCIPKGFENLNTSNPQLGVSHTQGQYCHDPPLLASPCASRLSNHDNISNRIP